MKQNRKITLKESVRGSISIFLVLVLVPLLTGTYFAIDAVRASGAKARLEGALNLTGNAALNSYDEALKDIYGLFAMSKSESDMQTAMTAVFSSMLDAAEGGEDAGAYENYLNTSTKSLTVTYPSEGALCRPDVLERTITGYMKYRAPYRFARGVGQRLGAFHSVSSAAGALEKSQDYYDSLGGVSKQLEKLGNSLPAAGSEEFDLSAERAALNSLEQGLPKLSKKVSSSEKSAEKWKSALDDMEEGEAKGLLLGDYKNTAEVLSGSGIEALQKAIDKDRKALAEYEAALSAAEEARAEAENPDDVVTPDPPALTYRQNALYGYIAGSRSASSEDAGANDTKNAMESIAGTDRSVFVKGVPETYVTTAVGKTVADAITAAGGSGAVASGSVKTFFSALAGSTDSLMSDSFVEEFLSEMFSCYTSSDGDKTLAGEPFSGKPLFRGEAEYILFGKDYLPTNVSLCVDMIFLVRVLFNSIYIFSSAKMRAEAFSLASAVAAWTGVGVAVVQNLILEAWAMAESVSDVSTLTKGGSVPLYKNAATWTLGASGISGKLKEGAVNLVSQGIDDVYAKVEKAADDKIEELSGAVLSYLSETGEGAVESLTNMILAPVESRLTAGILNSTETSVSYSKEDIRTMLSKAVSSVDNGSKGYAAAKKAFDTTVLEPLTGVVFDNYKALASTDISLSKTASDAIRKGLSDAYETLFQEVKKAVNSATSSAEKTIHNCIAEGKEAVKADVLEAIDSYAETLSGFLGSGSSGGSISRSGANTSLSSYSGTAMSYKDYLKVFLFTGLINNRAKTGMLTRAALVMQVNCRTKSGSINLAKTYRAVTVSGKAGIVNHTVKGEGTYAY